MEPEARERDGADASPEALPADSTLTTDPLAENLTRARLGRPPRDLLEATVVLEAWDGRPTRRAMKDAHQLVKHDPPRDHVSGHIDLPDDNERRSLLTEAIALVLSILSVAAWARPLSRELGAHVLTEAIKGSLPLALALQWGIRSRYLSRRHGLALLAHDGLATSGAMVLCVLAPVSFVPQWGRVAALLISVWVSGAVLTRRGWGLLYALTLVLGTVALDQGADAYWALGAMTAASVGLCAAALLSRRARTDNRPGGLWRALVAAVLGGGLGVLLVADPSLGWGVRGVHPAIALVPSVLGSFWGGYHLWDLYGAVPIGLSGVPLERASSVGLTDPAMRVFLGAVARLVGATVVLSVVVIALGRWTHGTDALSVFVAFGCAALVSMMVSLLESLSFQTAAAVAVAAAVGAELAWHALAHSVLAGGGLVVGSAVGMLVTIPPLIVLLSRSGRVLATTLWIR